MDSLDLKNGWKYEAVPSSATHLFRMCWQLENWLRTIVYVELRACRVDWEEAVKKYVRSWPPHSFDRDKQMHHMATPHQSALSYLTFGELWNIISDEENWELFEPYFPPKANVLARIDEVKNIRNRIAHFRDLHPQDENRFKLFMHDMVQGLSRFCSRYTVPKIVTDSQTDPVSEYLESVWDKSTYGVELCRPNGGWLYATEPHRRSPLLNADLLFMSHEKYTQGSDNGVVYCLKMTTPQWKEKIFDIGLFLKVTSKLHSDIIHLFVLSSSQIDVTVPAIHGVKKTSELLLSFLTYAVKATQNSIGKKQKCNQDEWPEYVLWPNHALAIYDEENSGQIFDLQ